MRIDRDAAGFRELLIIIRAIPIAAPFPNVAGHVVKAIAVRRELRDRRDTDEAIFACILNRKLSLVVLAIHLPSGLNSSPHDVGLPRQTSARREFKFRFGWQTFARPLRIRFRIGISDLHDRIFFFSLDAIIVGSGSLSFEMIRYLTERLPVMICPRWVFTRVQPIAIQNVLDYLMAALESPETAGRILEVGGRDVLTYAEMMTGYARARGLKRWLIAVPVLTPRLSSYWVHLITPIPARIAQPLIKGLGNEVIVRDETARQLFPSIALLDYETAVHQALKQMEMRGVETAWSDALISSQGNKSPVALAHERGNDYGAATTPVTAPAEAVYRSFASLGGKRGWLYMDWAWKLRGMTDRLCGGVGMRRGRRHPDDLRVGDALDFWRVEMVEPDRLIRLRAEMKVPGRAWLEFQALPQPGGQTLLSQTAFFEPKGLLGLLYWYVLYPIHSLIFSGLIRRIALQVSSTV